MLFEVDCDQCTQKWDNHFPQTIILFTYPNITSAISHCPTIFSLRSTTVPLSFCMYGYYQVKYLPSYISVFDFKFLKNSHVTQSSSLQCSYYMPYLLIQVSDQRQLVFLNLFERKRFQQVGSEMFWKDHVLRSLCPTRYQVHSIPCHYYITISSVFERKQLVENILKHQDRNQETVSPSPALDTKPAG